MYTCHNQIKAGAFQMLRDLFMPGGEYGLGRWTNDIDTIHVPDRETVARIHVEEIRPIATYSYTYYRISLLKHLTSCLSCDIGSIVVLSC